MIDRFLEWWQHRWHEWSYGISDLRDRRSGGLNRELIDDWLEKKVIVRRNLNELES